MKRLLVHPCYQRPAGEDVVVEVEGRLGASEDFAVLIAPVGSTCGAKWTHLLPPGAQGAGFRPG